MGVTYIYNTRYERVVKDEIHFVSALKEIIDVWEGQETCYI